MMSFDELVARFENIKPGADGSVTARCPAHDDRNNSLRITKRDDRVLLHCFAGCRPEDVCAAKNLALSDLFFNRRNGNHIQKPGASGLTLEEFAKAKSLDAGFLGQMGVVDDPKGSLLFHYLLMDGQRAPRQRIRLSLGGDRRFIWNKADGRPVPYGLWLLKRWRPEKRDGLVLCEGESDALTLWSQGIAALGIPGADNCGLLQKPHVSGFRRILICKENDQGGETFEKGCIGQLAQLEFEGDVAVVEMARAAVKDINDLHLKFRKQPEAFQSEWQALLLQARIVELPIVGLEVFDASLVTPKPLEWLWRNRIPRGKLILFVGQPGLGKSFVALYVVSQLSTGKPWADGCANGIVANSVVFSAEDSIEDTIVPRLNDLGADLSRIRLAKRIREANESGEVGRRSFNLARDLPHLERTLDRNPDTRLVVVDPVSAFMGRVDSHKNAEVRSDVLDPLSELAERRGVTVVAVTHFNKGSANSLDRISGSVAFPAAARMVWGFARDPNDPVRRLMLLGKTNISPEVPGLAFCFVGTRDGRATIEWLDGDVDAKLEEILQQEQESRKENKFEQACNLINRLCANGGEIPATELEAHARKEGIGEYSLKRARSQLGVKCVRKGFGPGSQLVISLPRVEQ